MGKVNGKKCKSTSPNPLSYCCKKVVAKGDLKRKHFNHSKQKDYEDVTCPVCLEAPHDAVLLLCSSYHKGCRPFMCATNHHFSNCLDQFRNVHTDANRGKPELLCPLCRGQVKGWTVVEEARKFLNSKKRACMHENCSYGGSLQNLKKHIKEKHPRTCPRAVDPLMEEKWKKLELERAQRDAISTVLSSTPGAVVMGDYVVEPHETGGFGDENGSQYLHLGSRQLGQPPHYGFFDLEYDNLPRPHRPINAPALPFGHLFHRRSRLHRRGNRGR